jgi:uncharacterized protein (DUF2252 family)
MDTGSLSRIEEDRAARLNLTRHEKMARSAHAYVRGSTANFYQWLESGDTDIPEGPPVWICGDCHLGNLGPLADHKGRVAVQIRDLDQTVIGNPAHDLIRLGLSLASSARGSDLPGVATPRILEQLIGGYESALDGEFESSAEQAMRPAIVRGLLDKASRRRWRHLAEERLNWGRPVVPLGKRFWPLTRDERSALQVLFRDEAVHGMIRSLQTRDEESEIELVDAAYWMKGCSSLGRLRFAAIVAIGGGSAKSHCLVDIKEATRATAPRSATAHMPRDNAVRVVTGAKALSPNLGERMVAARFLQKAVVLRELTPQDLKLEVGRMSQGKALALAAYLGGVVGKAHGRQMEAEVRRTWLRDLAKARHASIEAPSWLWTSVVALLAVHEAAYLEHCRRFALAHAN